MLKIRNTSIMKRVIVKRRYYRKREERNESRVSVQRRKKVETRGVKYMEKKE